MRIHAPLTDEELVALVKRCRTPDGVTNIEVLGADVLAMVEEIQGAREARMPMTLVYQVTPEGDFSYVTKDNLPNAERHVRDAIETGVVTKAIIFSARIEEEWEVKTVREAVRKK